MSKQIKLQLSYLYQGRISADIFGFLRIGTGLILMLKLIGGEAVLYKLIHNIPFKLGYPAYTFGSIDVYRLAGFHLPYEWLGWLPVPSFELYQGLEIVLLFSVILRTAGYLSRFFGGIIILILGYFFFLSQLSYHHHVRLLLLMCLVLVAADSGKRWSIDSIIKGSYPATTPVYLLSMLKILVSCIYLFSALGKINTSWLTGNTMQLYITENNWLFLFLHKIPYGYILISWGIVLAMLFLSRGFRYKRTRYIALCMGILLHLGIDVTFDVGTFSYQMILLYSVFFIDLYESYVKKLK